MRKIICEDVPKAVLEKRCQHYKTESIQRGEKIHNLWRELGEVKEQLADAEKEVSFLSDHITQSLKMPLPEKPCSHKPRRKCNDG